MAIGLIAYPRVGASPNDGGVADILDEAKAAFRAWETGGVVISRARKTNPPGFLRGRIPVRSARQWGSWGGTDQERYDPKRSLPPKGLNQRISTQPFRCSTALPVRRPGGIFSAGQRSSEKTSTHGARESTNQTNGRRDRSPWSLWKRERDSKMTEARRRVALIVERPDLLRALSLLPKSVDGHTDTYLFACGISKVLLAGLLRDGLATLSKARAGRELPIDIVRVKITDAGRQALE